MSSCRQNQKSTSPSVPRFAESVRDVYIREGETGCLECRVGGFPRPEVQWERNGRMVAKSRNLHLERIGDRCILRIKSCQSKDEGHYSCIATNIMGTATSRGILRMISGFKDKTRCRNGTVTASEKENSVEKKSISLTRNPKCETKFKSFHNTETKPQVTNVLKQLNSIPENGLKAARLIKKNDVPKLKDTTSNKSNSSQKGNSLSPGKLPNNYVREIPKKLTTKANIDKINQKTAPYNTLKGRQAFKTNQLTEPKSPLRLKSTSYREKEKPCVSGKDFKSIPPMKTAYAVKQQKVVTVATQRKVINNKAVPKDNKDAGIKDAKIKPIMRNKIMFKALNEKNGAQIKVNDHQKSAVSPEVRKKTVRLTRQKKIDEDDSFREQSTHLLKNARSPVCGTIRTDGTRGLKPSDSRKRTVAARVSTIVSSMTTDSREKNERTDSSSKVNSSKKKEIANVSWENRTGPDAEPNSNVPVQNEPKCCSFEGYEPEILSTSSRNWHYNYGSNLSNCSRESPKLKSDILNKKNIYDYRPHAKQQTNRAKLKKLNNLNEYSKFKENEFSNDNTHKADASETSYVDRVVILDSVRGIQTGDAENGSETSDARKDCNACSCVHKVPDTILSQNESSGVARIRSGDVFNNSDKFSCGILRSDVGDKFVIDEAQNHRSKSTDQNGWKKNNEHGRIPSDMSSLNKNGRSIRIVDLCGQVHLKCPMLDTVKLSRDAAEFNKCAVFRTRSADDKIVGTKSIKADISSKTVAGRAHSDEVFLGETVLRPGEKAVEHPRTEFRNAEENGSLDKFNPVATFTYSLTDKENEDEKSLGTETRPVDVSIKQTEVKDLNYIKAHVCEKREFPDVRTCKGNVRLNSDIIEEECEYFIPKIPEAEAEEDRQQVESQEEFPVRIVKGPQSVTVLRGESVTLAVHFQGTPQPTVTWARGGTTLRSDGRVSILVGRDMSVLTVSDVTADDSGKYVVTVENSGGGDSCFASMAVVGIPEPPGGQPTASDVTDHSLVLSWYGSMYDGGSVVTGYVIEMCTLPERRWHKVSSCVNTSHVVQGLSNGQHYVFRVRAENRYGLSQPSRESEAICLEDSSSEDWEISRSPVKIEPGSQFSEHFELKEEVGKGRFGTVYRCVERTSGRPRAAKVIRCIKAKDKETVQREISVMNKLHHPKLMQILAAFESGKNMIMVMEFISGGELFERVIADDFVLTEHDCVLFMRQICDGVAYMHKCCVLHLDLKPENILCKTRTCHQIKIIDFGLARVYNPDENLRVLFGTPEFVAPEVINYEPVGPTSDMWSVGVICYVLLSGLSPFMGESDPETFANITRGEMDFDDEAFDTISEDAKNFISLLLVKKQKDRMTAEECLKHRWLAGADWNASDVPLSTEKLKRFIVRRKWQKTGTAIRALGRMVSLSRSSLGSSGGSPSPLGSPKIFRSQSEISRSETSESGFSEMFSDTNSVSELIS